MDVHRVADHGGVPMEFLAFWVILVIAGLALLVFAGRRRRSAGDRLPRGQV